MASSSNLYGDRDPTKTKTKHKPVNSSTSLAFSSNLTSLIASSKSKPSSDKTTSKPNTKSISSAPKASLFTAHREAKNPKKRARDDEQGHQTSLDVGRAEQSELARSKRKMLEKTRLYNAMKRGEYIGRDDDDYDDRGLVDFDKKWADAHSDAGSNSNSSDDDSESGSDNTSNPAHGTKTAPTAQWTDEFGRLRHGTAKEKRRFERNQRIAAAATLAFEETKARPAAPSSTLIYGDTIQHAAFNPDTAVSERMASLAAKRDRPATPPPDTHYDGLAEVRTKGTGFFAFSADEATRSAEMAALEAERGETERRRRGRGEARDARRREVEERRRVVAERRTRREADAFLDALEIPDGPATAEAEGGGGPVGHVEEDDQ